MNFSKDTESVKESGRMNKILKTCTDTNNKLEAVYKPNGELIKKRRGDIGGHDTNPLQGECY